MVNVVLVDEQDHPIGEIEKLVAHQKGLLHRAFSVFIFRDSTHQELLIHKRHPDKYHSGGLWTNTCCSHPMVGESTVVGAHRRLMEEMGVAAELTHYGCFIYKAELDNGLVEHELDHVFVGEYDGPLDGVNPLEASDYAWIQLSELKRQLEINPQVYTAWLPLALKQL